MRFISTIIGITTLSLLLGMNSFAAVSVLTDEANVSVSGGSVDISAANGSGKSFDVNVGKGQASVSAQAGENSLKISGDGRIEIKTKAGSLVINGQIGRVKKNKTENIKIAEIEPVTYNFKGNKDVTLKNKYIDADAFGVIAGGNADVTIINCLIKAGTAIKAFGNSDVKIIGCTIIGNEFAILTSDNSTVNISDSSVTGKMSTQGNADIEDEENNEFID